MSNIFRKFVLILSVLVFLGSFVFIGFYFSNNQAFASEYLDTRNLLINSDFSNYQLFDSFCWNDPRPNVLVSKGCYNGYKISADGCFDNNRLFALERKRTSSYNFTNAFLSVGQSLPYYSLWKSDYKHNSIVYFHILDITDFNTGKTSIDFYSNLRYTLNIYTDYSGDPSFYVSLTSRVGNSYQTVKIDLGDKKIVGVQIGLYAESISGNVGNYWLYHTDMYLGNSPFPVGIDFDSVLDSTYEQGFNAGQTNGYDQGYNIGYNKGISDSNVYSFSSLMSSVIDAPIKAVMSAFDFEFLGTNMRSFLYSLLTIALVLFVVKIVLKGGS